MYVTDGIHILRERFTVGEQCLYFFRAKNDISRYTTDKVVDILFLLLFSLLTTKVSCLFGAASERVHGPIEPSPLR